MPRFGTGKLSEQERLLCVFVNIWGGADGEIGEMVVGRKRFGCWNDQAVLMIAAEAGGAEGAVDDGLWAVLVVLE